MEKVEAVEFAVNLLKECGARRVIPLKVSGPFHTSLLNQASIKLEKNLKISLLMTPKDKVNNKCYSRFY